jgi:hypothetical protein
VLGENSRKLVDALKEVLLKKLGKAIGQYAVESTLDQVVEDLLRDHPSIPEAATALRLNIMTNPMVLLPAPAPMPAQVPQAIPAAPAVRAIIPILPPVTLVQRDPFVSAASVQQQVIQYEVDRGPSTSANVEPSQREPVDHPTHSSSLPSSISISGSFTGASGSSLYTRY